MNGLPKVFLSYVTIWERLDAEYRRTPEWRFIRRTRILNEMHRLTKKYTRWLDAYMNKGVHN